MKKCNKCLEVKPIDDFQKCARNSDGHTPSCKICKRKYDNAHYKAHPERRPYIAQNVKAREEINRNWVYNYLLTHPCVDCPEADPIVLEFDHQSDKTMAVSIMINSNSLKRIQAEVAKCEVRCANCHRRKTAKDFGYWRVGYIG